MRTHNPEEPLRRGLARVGLLAPLLLWVPIASSDDDAPAPTDSYTAQVDSALRQRWEGMAECALEPLETFTLQLDEQGAITELDYQGHDRGDRQQCLQEATTELGFPPPPDGMRQTVIVRQEDVELSEPFSIESVALRCDEQVMDRAAFEAVIAADAEAIEKCHKRRAFWKRTLRGQVLAEIDITPEGRVAAVLIAESELDDARVERCLAERLALMRFPIPLGGCAVTMKHRFDFELTGKRALQADLHERIHELKLATAAQCGAVLDDQGLPVLVLKLRAQGGTITENVQLERYVVEEPMAACLQAGTSAWQFDAAVEARWLVHYRLETPLP